MKDWKEVTWINNFMIMLKGLGLIATIGLFVLSLFPEAAAAGVVTFLSSR